LENVEPPPSAVLPHLKPEVRRAMVPTPDGRQAGFISCPEGHLMFKDWNQEILIMKQKFADIGGKPPPTGVQNKLPWWHSLCKN